ncbi:MAG: diguanylate cyclase [Acidimicrobiia bacterium]
MTRSFARIDRSLLRDRRGDELATLRRRFTRRWVSGIAVGVLLVAANFVGYRIVAQHVRDDLDPVEHAGVAAEVQRLLDANIALTSLALIVLAALVVVFFRPLDLTLRSELRTIARIEQEQAVATARATFERELHEALEMAQDEPSVTAVVRHVFRVAVPDRPAELLLADSSDAHLAVRAEHPSAGRAGCGVTSPFDCPAVRRARPLTFGTSAAINACPHLRDRPGDTRSAHCVPLAFMGRSMGVLHVTGPADQPVDDETAVRLASVAGQVGTHLGTIRAFATAQLQASTDSLTGLLNRRSIEDELNRRLVAGGQLAVAMVDLDNFKLLNDTHGHDAGDRALRLFADTVRRSLRTDDLFARWGGEEFVIALPGMDRADAMEALDRVRLALVDACVRAETPTITASFGVADTTLDRSLEALLRLVDEALLVAKRSGKDRVVLAQPVVASIDDLVEPVPDDVPDDVAVQASAYRTNVGSSELDLASS